jgi:hypothetical protein
MRRAAMASMMGAALMLSAPAAIASTPRHDRYYEVWCRDTDGNLVQAESVDARAIEVGGKRHAIALFSANYPFGWECWPEGPFTS